MSAPEFLARLFRPAFAAALLAAACGLAAVAVAQVAADPVAPPAAPLVPEGTPEQLFEFIERLRKPAVKPASREEMLVHLERVANASVQAAERILAQVKPGDPVHARAARMKLESLMMLGQMGSDQAEADMAAYAAKLVNSPDKGLAREASRCLIVADARKALAAEDFAGVPGLVKRAGELLAADPDDPETAQLCIQLAGALEQVEGCEDHAAAAYRTFGPLFAKSGDPQIKALSESIAATLRRLALPGKPMEIAGTLRDGTAFDPKSLAGKVVLVDFWATWCGPCIAEMPNILAEYEKYHAKGFEVVGVSLDEDREAVDEFLADKKLPWPILVGDGWNHPMAKQYGISGIPQLILIGRDGNVITLHARGKALQERLAELFRDAG
jgi:thiol-disulfide isomerase/thioredoxin